MPRRPGGLCEPPTREALGALSPLRPAHVSAWPSGDAAALVRVCRTLDLERLRDGAHRGGRDPRSSASATLGPWSAGVICLQGLGRSERGLVGDLGLVKLLAALRGRPVEGWETQELLEPYGEWAGLASVYLLAGWGRGLVPGAPARRHAA